MVYRSECGPCFICGLAPAQHVVWADGRGKYVDWHADSRRFCGDHRPEKGPLPALDYKRLVRAGDVVAYERLAAYPEHACRACGEPPVFEVRDRAAGVEWWACWQHVPALEGAA